MKLPEFDIIAQLLSYPGTLRDNTLVRSGDDAAVIQIGNTPVAITTDSYVEGVHFHFDLSSPADLGVKIFHGTVSDIVAMGAHPTHLFLSLAFPGQTKKSIWQEMYQAISSEGERYKVEIAGGDLTSTTGGMLVSATAIGEFRGTKRIITRAGAQAGDAIFVTGNLGGSAAGLDVLLKNIEGYESIVLKHRRPQARMDLIDEISPITTSMIDISDGLSSEINHICLHSKCGAKLVAELIPLDKESIAVAELLGKDALQYALSGGEDYELLFTAPPEAAIGLPAVQIGEITAAKELLLLKAGKAETLAVTGYEHFRESV